MTTSESRSLGLELVGHAMWERLNFSTILKDCGFSKTQLPLAEAVVLGRLRERYPTIVRHYEITLELDADEQKATTVKWEKKATRQQRSALTGCYVIETSEEDLSAPEIWRLYTTLTKIEAAFRSLKTDLGVRPVYHQLAERTKGHLFISVLAYHLLISVEYQLIQKGDPAVGLP